MHSSLYPLPQFENVLIAADGTLRLCDFGSASTHEGPCDDKADRTEQEDAVLRYTTPHFRSPEMCDLYNGQSLDGRRCVEWSRSILPLPRFVSLI